MINNGPSINSNPDDSWFNFYIFRILSVCIFLLASPLAAKEPEKLTVSPAGTASWSDHLVFPKANPQYGKLRKVLPRIQRPESREVDHLMFPPRSVPASAPKLGSKAKGSHLTVTTGFQALEDTYIVTPPDTMGAVGPNHLMTMQNTYVRIQDKTGTDLGTVTLYTWWENGTSLSAESIYDPRIIFDSLSGRWMAVVDTNKYNLTTSSTWLAISQTDDPTGSWDYYSFNNETPGNNLLWHDFPDIGTNNHWIAITNNMMGGDGFVGAAMMVIDKTTIGGYLTVYRYPELFDLTLGQYEGDALRPALTFDSEEDTLYIVNGNLLGIDKVGLIRLSQITGQPPGLPTWSVVPDAAGITPGTGLFLTPESYNLSQINASQLGTTTRVRTNFTWPLNAVYRNGHLWTTHSAGRPFDGSPDRTVVCWYEIDPLLLNTQENPVVQSGTLDPGPDGHFFYPSITVNKNNDVALGFSHSNPGIYIEGVVAGRQGSDLLGVMAPISVIKEGEDSYINSYTNPPVSFDIRWGDYSATVVDPVDDTTFWTIQEYAASDVGPFSYDDRWGTWWARLSFEKVKQFYWPMFLPAIISGGD